MSEKKQQTVPCPTCREPAKMRAENPSFPFCSRRCKMVDLGQWFDESYRVAGKPASPEDIADHYRSGGGNGDPTHH